MVTTWAPCSSQRAPPPAARFAVMRIPRATRLARAEAIRRKPLAVIAVFVRGTNCGQRNEIDEDPRAQRGVEQRHVALEPLDEPNEAGDAQQPAHRDGPESRLGGAGDE